MPGPVFLAGDRVDLRTVEPDDAPFLARGRNHPEVRRWLPRAHPQSVGAAREAIEGDERDGVSLLACDGDEPVGVVSLFLEVPESGRAMLGAWVAPEAQGEGYGTAATDLLVEYAFHERRLRKLEAGALATNGASRAVLESVGFEREGRMADHYVVDGERVDRVAYGLRRADWTSVAND